MSASGTEDDTNHKKLLYGRGVLYYTQNFTCRRYNRIQYSDILYYTDSLRTIKNDIHAQCIADPRRDGAVGGSGGRLTYC